MTLDFPGDGNHTPLPLSLARDSRSLHWSLERLEDKRTMDGSSIVDPEYGRKRRRDLTILLVYDVPYTRTTLFTIHMNKSLR